MALSANECVNLLILSAPVRSAGADLFFDAGGLELELRGDSVFDKQLESLSRNGLCGLNRSRKAVSPLRLRNSGQNWHGIQQNVDI